MAGLRTTQALDIELHLVPMGTSEARGLDRPDRSEPACSRLEPHAELAAAARVRRRGADLHRPGQLVEVHPIGVIPDQEVVGRWRIGEVDVEKGLAVSVGDLLRVLEEVLGGVVDELRDRVPRLVVEPSEGPIDLVRRCDVDRSHALPFQPLVILPPDSFAPVLAGPCSDRYQHSFEHTGVTTHGAMSSKRSLTGSTGTSHRACPPLGSPVQR